MSNKCLVIVPAYNEAGCIEKTIEDLRNYQHDDYDILVINDCSNDETSAILKRINVDHLDLPVNLGLSGGVQCGFKYAYLNGYQYAAQFDGDGQHDAQYLHSMIHAMDEGYDIVIGSRFIDHKKPWSARMIGSRLIAGLIRVLTFKKINDPTSGMRMFNRKMIKDYAYHMNRRPEPDTLVYQIRHGATIKEVSVTMRERMDGVSLYSGVISAAKYMINMILSILFLSY